MQSLKKLLNRRNLYIFPFTFSVIKRTKFVGQLHWIALLPISLICTIFMCLILIVSSIYYEIVDLLLRLKHGDDYCGIMDGSDVVWVVEQGSASVINTLVMIDGKDGEGCESLFEFMRNSFENICETNKKMSCVRRYFMGYGYFLKTHIKIRDYLKYLEDYKDVEGLNLLMDKLSNSPLPAGNTALWEVYIGRVALKWENKGDKVQYPIFIKYHHSLGDGFSIVNLMTAQIFDNGMDIMKEKYETYGNILKKAALKNPKPTFLKNLRKMFTENYITYFGPLEHNDENMLHGKRLSHEKHVCYSLEKDSTNYVEKVKSIKNRLKGISFSDVIISAFSASCAEYYMAHDKNPPEKIRLAIPYYIASPNFENIANLKNNFAMGILNIRIKDNDIAKNMLNRLVSINKDSQISKDSLDFPFTFWLMKVVTTLIPLSISKYLIRDNSITVALSNFPGISSANLSSGHGIRDAFGWAPNILKCGITITIFTFDGQFRFGLLVDKEIIKEKSEVQQICDNIFKYIDRMDTMIRDEHI